jgi:hypothetical protein
LNSKLLDQLIYELIAAGSEIVETPLNDQIRSLYERFGQRPFVKTHLALLFDIFMKHEKPKIKPNC